MGEARIDFRDFIVGVTVRKEVDEATGMEDIVENVIMGHSDLIPDPRAIPFPGQRDAPDRARNGVGKRLSR